MHKALTALAGITLMAGAAQAQITAPAASSSAKMTHTTTKTVVRTTVPKAATSSATTMRTTTKTVTKMTAPMAAKGGKAATPHSAVSLDCSKQADAKGLHGKKREAYRSKCKHAGSKG